MKLPRETRAAIYEAKGKPVEIEVPPDEQCRQWQTYAMEGNRPRRRRHLDADALFAKPMIFVEKHERRGKILYAWVRLVDPSVYLARQQGRAHPQQYTGSIPDAIDDAERVPPEYQEKLSLRGRQETTVLGARGRAEGQLGEAERDIAEAVEQGDSTALAEGRRDRAERRLVDVNSPPGSSGPPAVVPRRRPSGPSEPEPPPVSAETVLRVLRDDDAAGDIAVRLGRPPTKLRSIVSALQELREQGRVFYYVDADEDGEQPVGRWRHRRPDALDEAA